MFDAVCKVLILILSVHETMLTYSKCMAVPMKHYLLRSEIQLAESLFFGKGFGIVSTLIAQHLYAGNVASGKGDINSILYLSRDMILG
jgi:hypothetical protein